MLTALRERFWALCGRRTVKKALRYCIICHKYNPAPCKPSHFINLPKTQVSGDSLFTHTGLDFARPCYIKEPCTSSKNGDSDSNNKVYMFIYTRIDSGRSSGIDSRTWCPRFHVDIPDSPAEEVS